MDFLRRCPCGCGKSPKQPRNTYARNGCWAKCHRDEMTARGRLGGMKSRPKTPRNEHYRGGYNAGFITGYRRGYASAMTKWKRWAEWQVKAAKHAA